MKTSTVLMIFGGLAVLGLGAFGVMYVMRRSSSAPGAAPLPYYTPPAYPASQPPAATAGGGGVSYQKTISDVASGLGAISNIASGLFDAFGGDDE